MIMIVGLDVWFREQRGFVSKKLEFFPNESIISNRILQTIIIEIVPDNFVLFSNVCNVM